MAHYSSGFERFWKLYPQTFGKRLTSITWKRKVQPSREGDVIDALRRQVDAGMFGTDPQFIPHARTWLDRMQWEDEIEPAAFPSGLAKPEPGKYDCLLT